MANFSYSMRDAGDIDDDDDDDRTKESSDEEDEPGMDLGIGRGSAEEEEEEEDEEDLPPSTANGGAGIKYMPILWALPTGQQRKAQKKPGTIFHAHERQFMTEVIQLAVNSVGGSANTRFALVSDEFRSRAFSLTYSIPRSQEKDIPITTLTGWTTMVESAMKKKNIEIVLNLTELEEASNKRQRDDESTGSDTDVSDTNKSKKKKTTTGKKKEKNKKKSKPATSPKEDRIAKNIEELINKQRCHSEICPNHGKPCFVDPMQPKEHLPLTGYHLDAWAAAIEEKVDGVDLEHPPVTGIFSRDDTADKLLKARRKLSRATTAEQPVINVHNYLSGPDQDSSRPPLRSSAVPNIPPKMDLSMFCTLFKLPADFEDRLRLAKVTGPHSLRFISDEKLASGAGEFEAGEIGELRDAEERWRAGVKE